ncbi:terminase small subunit [Asticcacaulis endophyticus]|uniref:Terminase n=1 Tax=Asticcacaulis endophyticus TaxID=1395890 RepID=A0A918UN59_9CAUL|nr:terminase small subunit [Asticcacaulis endophyticus]GGZ21819.1 terminase [Asticcacaulis endophyticus]
MSEGKEKPWPDDAPRRDLTDKQKRFVEEYLIDLNATQAAVRAGYSVSTAHSIGHENLSKPEIIFAISEAQASRSKRTEITADRVLQELAKVGFANASDVVNWGTKEVAFGFTDDGKRLPAEEIGSASLVKYVDAPFVDPINRDDLPDDIKAAVSEVKLTKDGFAIKMHDKVGALEKIGRHLGMFKDKVELTGRDGADLPAPSVTIFQLPDNGRG